MIHDSAAAAAHWPQRPGRPAPPRRRESEHRDAAPAACSDSDSESRHHLDRILRPGPSPNSESEAPASLPVTAPR
jgi:hypothetical protein